ncbi:hypothetical protein [Amazonocrinis nigriterrae]|nr:hypothetical protein [Amazonocrinis nigriterrae]
MLILPCWVVLAHRLLRVGDAIASGKNPKLKTLVVLLLKTMKVGKRMS